MLKSENNKDEYLSSCYKIFPTQHHQAKSCKVLAMEIAGNCSILKHYTIPDMADMDKGSSISKENFLSLSN